MPVLAGPAQPALPEFPDTLATAAILGDSGIVLNGDGSTEVDAAGCYWKHGGPSLWGSAVPKEKTGDRAGAHGQWDATQHYGSRTITINGTCRAPSHAALHDAERRLRAIVNVRPFRLRCTEPGFDGYAVVRQGGEIAWTENTHHAGYAHASFSIALYAASPLILSSLERSFGPASFPTSSGGLEWAPEVEWGADGVSWDAEVVSGREQLLNPGSEPVGMLLRANGPADTLAIALTSDGQPGQTLNLVDPDGGPVLRAGEFLLINTATHRVLLNGDASRDGWAYGDWLKLPAHTGGEVAIYGTGVDAATSSVAGVYRAARI